MSVTFVVVSHHTTARCFEFLVAEFHAPEFTGLSPTSVLNKGIHIKVEI